jgi:hypothetical protein
MAQTIAKTTRRAQSILANGRNAKGYFLAYGFVAQPVPMTTVAAALRWRSAKLRSQGNGTYTVRVHSNEWYTFHG